MRQRSPLIQDFAKNVVNSSYVLLFVCYCNVMLHVSHLKPVYIILQHSRPTFSKLSQADFHCTGCNKNDFYMFLVICLCVRMCFCFVFVCECMEFRLCVVVILHINRNSLFCKRKLTSIMHIKKYHMAKTIFSSRFGLHNV